MCLKCIFRWSLIKSSELGFNMKNSFEESDREHGNGQLAIRKGRAVEESLMGLESAMEDDFDDLSSHDENWFYVLEPGAQLEMNLFRWLRFSPGISYRKTYGSNGLGLSDNDLSNWSYNLTLKIGGFGKRNRERHKHSTEVISN